MIWIVSSVWWSKFTHTSEKTTAFLSYFVKMMGTDFTKINVIIPSRIGKLQSCRWGDPKFRTEENYFRYYLEPNAGAASPYGLQGCSPPTNFEKN